MFELGLCFDFFCHDLRRGVCARKFDESLCVFQRESQHVELDKARHGEPVDISATQQILVKGQAKTPLAQTFKQRNGGRDFCGTGLFTQRGDF